VAAAAVAAPGLHGSPLPLLFLLPFLLLFLLLLLLQP
jgi:hypothetical protein